MNHASDDPKGISRRAALTGLGAIVAAASFADPLGLTGSSRADAATVWVYPFTQRATITSGWGYRLDPATHEYGNHDGDDLAASIGTPIYAMRSGTVTIAGPNGGYGNFVGIEHDDGYYTGYGHQSRIVTSVGAKVSAGTLIGYSGNTGWTTGPHLHLMMHLNGASIDPTAILNAAPLATGSSTPDPVLIVKDDDMLRPFLIKSPDGKDQQYRYLNTATGTWYASNYDEAVLLSVMFNVPANTTMLTTQADAIANMYKR